MGTNMHKGSRTWVGKGHLGRMGAASEPVNVDASADERKALLAKYDVEPKKPKAKVGFSTTTVPKLGPKG